MSEFVLTCDTVIIGAGTAGLEAFMKASASGAYCILVESGPLGTSAKRTGDTPLSYLSAAGQSCHAIHSIERFGLTTKFDPAIDNHHVLNNLRAVRAKDTSEILSFIYRIPESNRLIGRAHFIDANTLMVNESHTVKFKTAVIATGSVPVVPYELSKYQSQGVYTTQDFFELDQLPQSIAIFGSNREGLQLGQALSYLGVRVVVFGNNGLWNLTDESVISAAVDAFNERFDLVLNSYTTAIEKYERGFGIYYLDSDNYENHMGVDTILTCSIRYPKLDGLNLRAIGMDVDRNGCIKIDEQTMQTSIPHIFAAGDVTNTTMTTDKARQQGAAAGTNAVTWPDVKQCQPAFALNILATDPEMAMVGMSYEEVKVRARAGNSFISAEVRSNSGLFLITHNDGGLLRMYVDESSHKILGAELCMHDASHLAHLLAMAIAQELTIEQVAQLPYFTPSYEAVIKSACEQAIKNIARKAVGL